MKGLDLSERFYETNGRPMISRLFAPYQDRMAIGLVGEGSECFGYDDKLSKDHDFGPSFCIWLMPEDFRAIGEELRQAYAALPDKFMGFSTRRITGQADDRIGVLEINRFYRNQIGRPDAAFTLKEWLKIPEFRLATVTNGRVFHDPAQVFSGVRNTLLGFYPEDVRIKKIATRAVLMGQSGQYNYARCMARGEIVAARLALTEFIQHGMAMFFLLNRTYAPFYKWVHRAFRDLPLPGDEADLIAELAAAPLRPEVWADADRRAMLQTLNRQDRIVEIIEMICAAVKEILQANDLTGRDDDFLAAHGDEIMARIADHDLRMMHVLEE